MSRPLRIVIVGAGVAGAILARTLSQLGAGVEVTCLEQVSRDDHSEAGTGLNIGPNAVKALRHHDAALADAIDAAALPWCSWRLSLANGRELFNMPLSDVADCSGWRIRWSELYRVLREHCDTIRYDCTIRSCGPQNDGTARSFVTWSDAQGLHRLENINLLIAADGRYSRIRETFLGTPKIHHLGVAIFRLLVPDTSHGLIDDYEQWFEGPHRLLAFRVPPGHIYIAGSLPIMPGDEVANEAKTAEALQRVYSPVSGPPSAQVAWMVAQVAANTADIHWARMQEATAAYRVPGCNVLFVGDSAHAMVPTLAQGATQAIEDACVFGALLARSIPAGLADLSALLDEAAAARHARMRFVMDFSREASDTMLTGADPVAGSLLKIQPAFLTKLCQLYRDVPIGSDTSIPAPT